jgi:N-acetylglucosaminyl-diphospho-decaprenol L-rhamnosyltransferase
MKLSILIVNWNSKDLLRDCLASIRSTCRELAPQVVVVDGGSFDGCAELIAKEFPEVDFVQSNDNVGFGRSNNLGFSRVKGETLLLLNPDTVLCDGAVRSLLEAMESHPDAGIVGAHLLNSDGSLQLFGVHPLPTPWNCMTDSDKVRSRWWAHHGPPDEGRPVTVEAVSGACMLMKAAVFRALGGFDSRYFMYAEDMDLCLKVTRTGSKVYYAPDARVIHHGGGCSKNEFSKFSTIMIREALWVYMRINHGAPTALLYRWLMAVSAVFRLLLLAAMVLISGEQKRQVRVVSLKKWWSVLRWCVGLESWAGDKFRECSKSAGLGARSSDLSEGVSKPC